MAEAPENVKSDERIVVERSPGEVPFNPFPVQLLTGFGVLIYRPGCEELNIEDIEPLTILAPNLELEFLEERLGYTGLDYAYEPITLGVLELNIRFELFKQLDESLWIEDSCECLQEKNWCLVNSLIVEVDTACLNSDLDFYTIYPDGISQPLTLLTTHLNCSLLSKYESTIRSLSTPVDKLNTESLR